MERRRQQHGAALAAAAAAAAGAAPCPHSTPPFRTACVLQTLRCPACPPAAGQAGRQRQGGPFIPQLNRASRRSSAFAPPEQPTAPPPAAPTPAAFPPPHVQHVGDLAPAAVLGDRRVAAAVRHGGVEAVELNGAAVEHGVQLAALALHAMRRHPRLVLVPEALRGHRGVLALQLVHALHARVELEGAALDGKLGSQARRPRRRRHHAADARGMLHHGPAAAGGAEQGPRGGWGAAGLAGGCGRVARRRRRAPAGRGAPPRPHLTTSAM